MAKSLDAGKRRRSITKRGSPKGAISPKQHKGYPSLLDKNNYSLEGHAELSDFDRLYLGQPLECDDIDPTAAYLGSVAVKEEVHPSTRSFWDNDYGEDFTPGVSPLPSPPPNGTKHKRPTPAPESFPDGDDGDDDDDYEEFVFVAPKGANPRPPFLPPLPPPPPAIQTVAQPIAPDVTDDEDAIKNLALRIAEDFAKHENIVLVGGALYAYNGSFYSLMSDNDVLRKVLFLYRQELGQANTVSVLRNVASLLKLCVTREYEEFPVNANLVVFANGTLEIDTGIFRRNSPDDLATSALAVSYDPDREEMAWTKYFLKTIANGDDDLYERILQVIGYILSNDVKAKSFFYLEGVSDAGKSRFCDLIASFFPVSGANKVARIALQDLGGKFALGNLVNAKLNISEDLPDKPLSPVTVSRIKMLSDSNRLEAEAKYVQAFSFRPLCKLLFASNHPLRLKEYDEAFANRVVYIPFLHPIPKNKQDKHILERMQRELPALFNHAFKAYQRLVANGYTWAGADRFNPNISIVNFSTSIDKRQVLDRFVAECCVFDEDAITPTADLQATYTQFCRSHTYLPIQGDRFSRELSAVLPDTVTRVKIGNQKRGFQGVRIKVHPKLSKPGDTDNGLE